MVLDSLQPEFSEVLTLIKTTQQKVIATANQEMIKLSGVFRDRYILNFLNLPSKDQKKGKIPCLQQFESGWLQPPTLKPNINRTFNICGVSHLNAKCCNLGISY